MSASGDTAGLRSGGRGPRARVGVLVSHGFTGSPVSVLPWAQHFADAGFAVELPLLEGHGTSWQEMGRTRWQQWYGSYVSAYRRLARDTDVVVSAGLSMGGTLALRLAAQYPVAGTTVVNPALTFSTPLAAHTGALKYVIRSLPSIGNNAKKPGVDEGAYPRTPLSAVHQLGLLFDSTKPLLTDITTPVQVFRSRVDGVVPPSSLEAIEAGLPAVPEVITLGESYHVATMDNDAPRIFDESLRFVEQCCASTLLAGGVR